MRTWRHWSHPLRAKGGFFLLNNQVWLFFSTGKMDDLCDQMNNSQVWDPEENYDLFIYDYHDYERFILSGMDFDDTHEKVMRATSYVRLFFRVFNPVCHLCIFACRDST